MSQTIFGFDAATLNAFDAAYTASLPPALQALMLMNPANNPDGSNPRAIQAGVLANQGFVIDVEIMAYAQDPYMTMYFRQLHGLTSVMDGLGNVKIKVSTNPADFPPYAAPAVPTDPSDLYIGGPIGGLAYQGAHWYPVLPGSANLPNGIIMQHQGHTLQLQAIVQQTGLSSAATQLIYTWVQLV